METPNRRPTAWWSLSRALLLVLLGWLSAALIALVSYLALGHVWVPITVGVALCLCFAVGVGLLHSAGWLSVLSAVPALLVLVGAVQYAPEAALERRGVSEAVTLTVDEQATSGNHNVFAMHDGSGRRLDEDFVFQGSSPPYGSGDRITVIVDPEGVVDPEDAQDVDSAGSRTMLLLGAGAWTLIALYAGRRGHVRRRAGRRGSILATLANV